MVYSVGHGLPEETKKKISVSSSNQDTVPVKEKQPVILNHLLAQTYWKLMSKNWTGCEL